MVGILLENIWNSITIYAAFYFHMFNTKCHNDQAYHINMPCNVCIFVSNLMPTKIAFILCVFKIVCDGMFNMCFALLSYQILFISYRTFLYRVAQKECNDFDC